MTVLLKTIPLADLDEFADAGTREAGGTIAITPSRARSQMSHPMAKKTDPGLWVAVNDQNNVVGFAGSIPGADDRNGERLGWNSCWWVDEERGREAAMPLLMSFIRHWDERVAFSDMTGRTHAIISALRFCHTRKEPLIQAYCRLPAHRLSPPAKFLAGPVNLVQGRRLKPRTGDFGDLVIRVKSAIEPDEVHFMETHNRNDFSRRPPDEFSWAMNAPWLVGDSPENRAIAERYPFSHMALEFRMMWIVTRRRDELTSLMLVSVRDGVLKVLYYFGSEPGDAICGLKQLVAEDRKIYSILFAHPALLREKGRLLKTALFHRTRDRYVGVSKKIMESFTEDTIMQLGDGDALFT